MPKYFQPRTPIRFESSDGEIVATFPRGEFEYEAEQSYRDAYSDIAGAGYAFRHAGTGLAPKGVGRERLRFMIQEATPQAVDATFDDLKSRCRRAGLGKLFTQDVNGNERWAWAASAETPRLRWRAGDIFRQAVSLDFTRTSDWFGDLETDSVTISATPATFTLHNPGNAPVRAIVFRFRSSATNGFTNPSLTNDTNDYEFSSTRDGTTANHELRVDTETGEVEFSTNDGADYTNDLDNFSRGSAQVDYMILEPGDNEFEYVDGGTPDLDIDYEFYPAYE